MVATVGVGRTFEPCPLWSASERLSNVENRTISVTAKVGKPSFARCGGGPHRIDFNEEYGYSHPFTPVAPRFFEGDKVTMSLRSYDFSLGKNVSPVNLAKEKQKRSLIRA
jgi:hypothetical protein